MIIYLNAKLLPKNEEFSLQNKSLNMTIVYREIVVECRD
jgi:hypothetical protein